MLAYYQRKLHPSCSCTMNELTEPFQRSSSPSKDKAPHYATRAVPVYLQPRMLFLYVISVMLLVLSAATFSHNHQRHQFRGHQQLAPPTDTAWVTQSQGSTSQTVLQAKLPQITPSADGQHNTNSLLDQQLQDNDNCSALAADVAKYKTMATKSYTLLKDARSAYKSVRSAASKAAAELQALQKVHAETKAQLQVLQEQNAALQALVAQDSYAMIVTGKAEAVPGHNSGNSTEQDHELLMLAGKVALAVPNTSGTGSASTSKEVVLVVCDAAHSQGIDAFRSWCQSTALAELDNTIVLAADDDCSHVAHEAGLHSTPYSRPQGSRHVQRQAYSLRKYAAVQVLLAEGFSVLAAEPDMLLVDSPYQHLLPSPLVDLHVASDALNGDGLVDGHVELQEDTTQQHTHHSVHMAGLSPALMHLKPNRACLEFVNAMVQGLRDTTYSEQQLLDQLLLSPSHMLPSSKSPASASAEPDAALSQPSAAAAGEGEPGSAAAVPSTTAATSSAALDGFIVPTTDGPQPPTGQLQAPPRLRLLPVTKFTTSAVLFGVHGRSEWLVRTAPAAIHVVHNTDKAQRMAAIVNSYRGLPGPLEALPAATHTTAQPVQRAESSSGDSENVDAGHSTHPPGVPQLMNMLHPVEQLLERLGLEQ